jgi:hypothetical protein
LIIFEEEDMQQNQSQNQLPDEELIKLARQRVEAKRGFFIHLSIYVCVNVFIFLMWFFLLQGPSTYPWFLFVIFGWGIGVAANAIAVFVAPKGSGWEKKQIEKELQNLRKGQ